MSAWETGGGRDKEAFGLEYRGGVEESGRR